MNMEDKHDKIGDRWDSKVRDTFIIMVYCVDGYSVHVVTHTLANPKADLPIYERALVYHGIDDDDAAQLDRNSWPPCLQSKHIIQVEPLKSVPR